MTKQNYALTFGLNLSHTSTVKIVALLLNADERDDIKVAIITAIIKPTKPTGRTFKTSLEQKFKNIKNLLCVLFTNFFC